MQSSASIQPYYTTAVDALYAIGRTYLYDGKIAAARHLLEASLHLLEVDDVPPSQRFQLLLLYGQVLIVDHLLARGGGDVERIFATVEQARQLAEASQSQRDMADALSLLGQAHYFAAVLGGAIVDDPHSGRYDEALAYQEQALRLRESLNDTRGISESLFQIGVIHERWQRIERSEEYYSRARQLAEQHNHPFEKTEPARHFAIHALMRGELDLALDLAQQALHLREEAGFKPYQPLDHLLLRDVYQAKGDQASAQIHARQAADLATSMGYPTLVSTIGDTRSRLSSSSPTS
ncbi:hypothetical protein KDH_72170 [Dictyobacter sp. S3.2.2.5]|uniref:MalT-like TPR region domain-containing protein n=1 Tax=Dictyobacter halimunensis TaxID=3026934 RepID=A0ABQ6G1J2_9CHLR|nr:hypothetical protein KDH_72170 [Dictyobacter sp. S3.2.2.5]